jgi:L-alanine-DL-glutamate epimerase-like enolase superfamily enzyme
MTLDSVAVASPPQIEAVRVVEVRVPRRPSNRITTTYGTLPDAHFALIVIEAEGLVGVGEASTDHWWTGEDAQSVRHVTETYLAPALTGCRVGPREAAKIMSEAVAWNPYAKAAVEMALWDLLARAVGLPLHVLLGASEPRPVPIKYVIGFMDADRAREEVVFAREHGFRFLKMKVGTDVMADINRVATVVDALQAEEQVGVDAQANWSPLDALKALGPLESLGVAFVEQPVSPAFPDALKAITSRARIPIIAHESIFTLRDGAEALARRLADIWALTPNTHSGLVGTLDLLALARSGGIPCLLGSTVELGIGSAFLAQVGTTFDEFVHGPIPSDVIGPLYHEDDIVVAPPAIADGYVHVPPGPGLGVELDWDRVTFYEVRN